MKLSLVLFNAILLFFLSAMQLRYGRQIESSGDYRNALLSEIVPLESISCTDSDLYKEVDKVCCDASSLFRSCGAHSFEQLRLLIDRALPGIYIEDRFVRILVHLANMEEDIGLTVLQLLTLSDYEWFVIEAYYSLSVVHDTAGLQQLFSTPLMLGLSDTCWAVLLKLIVMQRDENSFARAMEYGIVSRFTLVRVCKSAYIINRRIMALRLLEASYYKPIVLVSVGDNFIVNEQWLQQEQRALAGFLNFSKCDHE